MAPTPTPTVTTGKGLAEARAARAERSTTGAVIPPSEPEGVFAAAATKVDCTRSAGAALITFPGPGEASRSTPKLGALKFVVTSIDIGTASKITKPGDRV